MDPNEASAFSPDLTDARDFLEQRVNERALHSSAEDVQTTCSFARAERLLGREYHGRFLIELLQNAADAWRRLAKPGERSSLAVILDDGPALVVANRGEPLRAETVIESLGHIGRSTKAQGEAIGHKGIGFKSVLEITMTPELYSGLQRRPLELAVGFDPAAALERIHRTSGDGWKTHIRDMTDIKDELSAVPVLRYPHWIDEPPAVIRELVARGFDTAVRLPFDEQSGLRHGLDRGHWLKAVRESFDDVTDQMLMLLGTFDEVRIEDRLSDTVTIVAPHWVDSDVITDEIERDEVEVSRNGQTTSRWRLYRQSLPDAQELSAQIAVGLRLADVEGPAPVLAAVENESSSPFHLFFPTRIGSGLPLLLHGYFEVDAARTGFYAGSQGRNEAILEHLAELAARAIADTAAQAGADLANLVHLVGVAPEPEDALARHFRQDTLRRLDNLEWVPLEQGAGQASHGRPPEVLADQHVDLVRQTVEVFPPEFVRIRTGLGVPASRLSNESLKFLAGRRPLNAPDLWASLVDLLRPGRAVLWAEGAEDAGFRKLLDLVAMLEASDRVRTGVLIDSLRGDANARLLPALAPGGYRELLAVPDPSEGVAGQRSTLVMARVRTSVVGDLVPPAVLDVAFLPDGLLQNEAEVDRAKPLGVRPFTVDNLLDRLGGLGDNPPDPAELVRFVWRLLARERRSEFGTAACARRAAVFNPSDWFWCRPGRADGLDAEGQRQRRERNLAEVSLPARGGGWRPSGMLAFGHDWASWLESGACGQVLAAATTRAFAYRALETIRPDDGAMLDSPDVVLALLPEVSFEVDADGASEPLDAEARNCERFAFLLRLGVWEVVPVESFESRAAAGRTAFPWDTEPLSIQRAEEMKGRGGWSFDRHRWSGKEHHSVYTAEDFHFLWPLTDAATRDALSLTRSLTAGAGLYASLKHLAVFCPRCNDAGTGHIVTYRSSADDQYPSLLALELGRLPWIPVVRDGHPVAEPVMPADAWWSPRPPTGSGLPQSPLRFLNLCDPDAYLSDDLRRLARIHDLESADVAAVHQLLAALRREHEDGVLPADPLRSATARQAFVGLHRLAYERLGELAHEHVDQIQATVADVGILCEIGDALEYRPAPDAFHHDGTFAAYRRHFSGKVPLAVLAPDKAALARTLGVTPFVVSLARRRGHDEEGIDVTGELHDVLADRVTELLAIVVHHSLGTQTLDPGSRQFEERSQRLRNLKVRQVADLVLDAQVSGTDISVVLGEGVDQDAYLEGPTSPYPILYHDFNGDGWPERLRRKLASHLAALLENPAYTATFALFLLAENDGEREVLLQDLGITSDEVDALKARLGAVTAEDVKRHLRWYTAILACRGAEPQLDGIESAHAALLATDLPDEAARRLVELGGGENVRGDTSPDGALRLLLGLGFNLDDLNGRLLANKDSGLDVRVARDALDRWRSRYGKYTSAVLAQRMSSEEAKVAPRSWVPPEPLANSLEPPLVDVLGPVATTLRSVKFDPDVSRLAGDPETELMRLAGLEYIVQLQELTARLYSAEEQVRVLGGLGTAWRRQLLVLGVLARIQPAEGRAALRSHGQHVEALLPPNPPSPSALRPSLPALFTQHRVLAAGLEERLTDSFTSLPPNLDELLELAARDGLPVSQTDAIRRALAAPRRDLARQVRDRIAKLNDRRLRVLPPPELHAVPPPPSRPLDGRKVATVHIPESTDQRKRQLGDEGERWALAALLDPILALSTGDRSEVIQTLSEFLGTFHGDPVDRAREHAAALLHEDLDGEELIDELRGFLHVAIHSAAFGFDLLGWLPPEPGAESEPMCVEVKSSRDGSFFLSSGEWSRAQHFADPTEPGRYAVLVVRRSKAGGPPTRLDLLVDPVGLVDSGQLTRADDNYKITYEAAAPGIGGDQGHPQMAIEGGPDPGSVFVQEAATERDPGIPERSHLPNVRPLVFEVTETTVDL